MPQAQEPEEIREPNGLIFGVLRIALWAGVALIAWLNIKPYVSMVDGFLYGDGSNPLILLLLSLPIVGGIARFFTGIWSMLWGALIWAGFQTAEVLPVWMKSSKSLKRIIHGIGRHRKIQVRPGAGKAERMLVREYNEKPNQWLAIGKLIALCTYLLDFVITIVHYPPVEGGMAGLQLWLAAPTFGAIDWKNIALTLMTLFAFETAVWIAIWVWEGQEMGLTTKPEAKQWP